MKAVQFFALLSVVLCVTSCKSGNVDLHAVRAYALTAEAARESFDAIAADYDASCLRAREYQVLPADALGAPQVPQSPAALRDSPDAGDPDGLAPLPAPAVATTTTTTVNAFFPKARTHESCIALAQPQKYPVGLVSAEWRKADDALLAFVQGIGKIANVGTPPKPTGKLSSALVDARAMTTAQATAINGLGRAIADFFIRHRQQQSIGAFLNAVDPRFPEARDALLGVARAYRNVIDAECNVKDSFFERSLASVRDRYLVPMPAAAAKSDENAALATLYSEQYVVHRIRSEWATANAACRTHLDSVASYVATVERIAATEADLFRNLKHPGSVDIGADANDLNDAVDGLHSLLFPQSGKKR